MKHRNFVAACAAALLAFTTFGLPLARAATIESGMQKREISVNGSTLYNPYSFVRGGTTYMPIWYVMKALRQLGVPNAWNGARRQWRVALQAGPSALAKVRVDNAAGIYVAGVRVANVPSMVARDPLSGVNTTYMPIWYVSRVLKTADIHSSWDGRVWNLLVHRSSGPSTVGGDGSTAKTGDSIGVSVGLSAGGAGTTAGTSTTGGGNNPTGSSGGAASAGAGGSSSAGSGSSTSGGGTVASLLPGQIPLVSVANSGGQLTIDGQTVPQIGLQNAAAPDSAWWSRASARFYLSAQTNNPATGAAGTPLLNAAPGQTLYLFAFRNTSSVPTTGAKWFVNSPDATITPGHAVWTSGGNQTAKADFVATRPGVYTVQAEYGGKYSEPLVVTVGYKQLGAQPFAVPATLTGVLPLPAGMAAAQTVTHSGVTYSPSPAVGDWLPVSGSTTRNIGSVTVLLLPQTGQGQTVWDFRLPVVNGRFSGLLRSPFGGQVQVVLFPDYLQTLTRIAAGSANGSFSLAVPSSSYTVNVAGAPPDVLARSLLPSSQGDYNMSPRFAHTAATLLENSPSLQTAVQAISNYASEALVYDTKEVQAGPNGSLPNYKYQENLAAWNAGSGICQDYATLAASLLQSIGLPTQLLGGYANPAWTAPPASDANPQDSHAWIQVWTGSAWIPIDPTWADGGAVTVNAMITNQFFGNTSNFQRTHLLVNSQSYYPLAR